MSELNTVDRALRLVELIVNKPMRIGEIADVLDIHKSSASRLVQTLESHNYLRNSNGLIMPGYGILRMASRIQENIDLRDVAKPYTQKLGEVSGGTIHLAVMDEHEVIYIDKVDSIYTVRMYSSIGKRSPVYCTGVGKAMLAYLPDKELRRVMDRIEYKAYTPSTITSGEQLLQEIKKIRAERYAFDNGEHEEEIRCIASPIFNFEKKVVGAISISITISRTTIEELLSYKPLLLESTGAISEQLGYT